PALQRVACERSSPTALMTSSMLSWCSTQAFLQVTLFRRHGLAGVQRLCIAGSFSPRMRPTSGAPHAPRPAPPPRRRRLPWGLFQGCVGSMINGSVQGPAVRTVVTAIRSLYEFQEFNYAGPYREDGWTEHYIAQVHGAPIGCIVVVARNA